MTPNEIRNWRFAVWADFIGAANRRPVERLQRATIRQEPPGALAIIGPYGSGKSSLARHLITSFCCEHPSPDGDPCHICWACTHQGQDHNGVVDRYAHWELDCTAFIDRTEIRQVLHQIQEADHVAVFWDEFQRLRVKSAQSMLLKPSEDTRGLWIVAMTDDQYHQMDPQLFERYRKVWLAIPTAVEMADFLQAKAREWSVTVQREIIDLMVDVTQRSFRSCLNLLAAGAENPDRVLDRATLEEFLSLDRSDDDCLSWPITDLNASEQQDDFDSQG